MTIFTGFVATAQCTPDPQFTSPGVYPDSLTGFANACVGEAYDQLITNVVPVDTTMFIGPIPVTLAIDSVVVVSVTGLPPGFSFSCFDGQNVSSLVDQCAFEGGTTGCISISGTPSPGDEGLYLLSIVIDTYMAGQPTPQFTTTIDDYRIEVLPSTSCSGVGIEEVSSKLFSLYPNPVQGLLTLNGLSDAEVSNITITDSEGKVISSYVTANSASLDINVSNLEGGIYFIYLANVTTTDVVRFIKE
jgi:hypothetical protein